MRALTANLLRNRHALWAMILATVVFGIAAYRALPVQLFPDTDPPLVSVVTAYPGAEARDVARDLSRPLEEEFASLEGIVAVRSNSEDDLSIIQLEFGYERDADLAAVDVQNSIARIADQLPREIREPQVLSFDTSDGPVVTFGVVGEDLRQARRYAEDRVAPELQRLPGVAAVDVFGGHQEAVVVEIDKARLAALGGTIERVVSEILRQNTAQPAGRIRTEHRETLYRVETRPATVEQLANTAIPVGDGSRVVLSQLGQVRLGHLDEEADFAIDGQRAVAVQVFKTDQGNTVDVVRRAEEAVRGDPQIVSGEESASFTETSIANLFSNVMQAILLAALIILLFLGRPGASVVAAISMPLSYGLTFMGMYLLGVEFNMVTLSAVILAVGMVVDASVVVLENIVRFREAGHEPEAAAVEGTADVATAVLAGAATTTAVLIPLLVVPGFVGATFGPLAQTLLLAFISSVAVALIIVPVLSLYMGRATGSGGAVERLTAPFRRVMEGLRKIYLRVLRAALNQRTLTLLLAAATFVAGVSGIKARGMEVLPQMDGGSFFISFETPSGTSLNATNEVARHMEALLAAEPEVIKVQRQTGYERGMRSFSATGAQGSTQGFISVTLTPRTERDESVWEIQDRVRRSIRAIPGLETLVVREMGNTAKSTTDAPIGVRLSGDDPLVLDHLAAEVLEALKGIDGVVDPVRTWRIDSERQKVAVDPLRAGRLGVSPREVGAQMQSGSEGLMGGEFFGERPSSVPVLVRYQDRYRSSDLLDFPLFSPVTGESIPLRAVADLVDEIGPALVTRENLVETLDITAQSGDRPLSFVMADVERAMSRLQMPAGYELTVTGERSDLDEARGGLGRAMLIAIAAVYLLLLAQLRSFSLPLVIMMSVPLSLVGVSAALGIAGQPVSMPVMVGLILLVGIVVNNAIILLDVVSRAIADGADRRQALMMAVEVRFRPIMMTSVSTVVGMIPLAAAWALGAERFSPLAIAVMGGMIASTLLTMIVIPVFYDIMESLVEKVSPNH